MGICSFSNPGVKTTRLTDVNVAAGTNALLQVYTGAPPSDASVAATGTLLATLTCSATAFGTVTPGVSGGAPPHLTANPIITASGVATGIPGYCRVLSSVSVPVVDLDVGAAGSGASVILTPNFVTTGLPVVVTSIVITEA